MKSNGFPKKDRLCGEKKIGKMFQKGRSGFVFPFRYMCYKYQSEEIIVGDEYVPGNASVLISVSKRYHKRANKRNLLKRRIREAYRTGNSTLKDMTITNGAKISLGLIYSTKEVLDYKVIENAVGKIISEIVKSA